MKLAIEKSRILITGGTGSWGHELVRQLLQKYPQIPDIRIYSRGEHKQVNMKRTFAHAKNLRFIIGDVRDKNILNYAMQGIDIVFHLAALKHVPICEDNTWEAVLTNIYGSQNVVEAAINNNVKKIVDVSTDKAVEPFNLYGMTKAVAEKLIVNANFNYDYGNKKLPQFICIRGGNVIGTNGSVIPLFKKQIIESNQITVTDQSMTRFLMSTQEAISLIFTAVENSIGGELFVMKMPAASVETIANTMKELFGNNKTKIKFIGARPGEKKHEVLISKNESPFASIFSDKIFVILPQTHSPELSKKYSRYKKLSYPEFSSQTTEQLTQKHLLKMLKREQWLFT